MKTMNIPCCLRPVDDSSINTAKRQLSSFKTEKLLIDKASLKVLKECLKNKCSQSSLRFSRLKAFEGFLTDIILIQLPHLYHPDVMLKIDLQQKEYQFLENCTFFLNKHDVLKEKWKIPEDSKCLLKESIKHDRIINEQDPCSISEMKDRLNSITVNDDLLFPVTTANFLIEWSTRIPPFNDKIEDILYEKMSYSEDGYSGKNSVYEKKYNNFRIVHRYIIYAFVPMMPVINSPIFEPLRNFKKRKLKSAPQAEWKYISRLILENQQESICHNKFIVKIPGGLKTGTLKPMEGINFYATDRILEKRNYSKLKLALFSWKPFENLSRDDALEDDAQLDTKQFIYPKNESETRDSYQRDNFILFRELEKNILLESVSESASTEQQREITNYLPAGSFQKLNQFPKSSELFQVVGNTETDKRRNSILPTEISSLSAIEVENKDQPTITENRSVIHQESDRDTVGIDLDTLIMVREKELTESIFEMDNVVISTLKPGQQPDSTLGNSDLSEKWLTSFNNTVSTSTDLCFRRIALNTKFAKKYRLCNSTFLELSGHVGASLSVHEFEYNDPNLEFDLFISSTCSIIIINAVQTYQVSSETGNLIIIDNLDRLSVQASSLIFVIIDDSELYPEQNVKKFIDICRSMSILTVMSHSDENILFSNLCSLIKEYGEVIYYSEDEYDLENDLFYSVS